MDTLGKRLKETREARGLSQTKLAEAAGCAQSSISMLEKNERTERPDLIAIAHALGVDAYWLKTGIRSLVAGDKIIDAVVQLMVETEKEGRAVVLDKATEMKRLYPKSDGKKAA